MDTEVSATRQNGMKGLFIIWLGQMVSGTATTTTFYAFPLWISEKSGASGSALAFWEAFFFASYLFCVLFALFFIDRYPRKAMMLAYDLILMLATAILLVLQTTGKLQIWHLYLNAILQGLGDAFRLPSYSSVITLLLPRKQYVRANGMLSVLYETPEIFGPLLAGLLYISIGLTGILVINLLSFIISIAALLSADIPPVPQTPDSESSHAGFFKEAMYGIRYILRRPGLLGVQLIFLFGNFFSGIALSVTALYTLIALRTDGNVEIVGVLQSGGALAAVLVGALLSIFGGIKQPVRTILLGWIISSLFGLTLLGIGQVFVIWLIAKVIDSIFNPIVNVAINDFLQVKVPPYVQGRVFSASEFLAQVPFLVTPFLAGFLGDKVFEPAMRSGGALTNLFGWLVGIGPGSGYGLMILLCGLGGTLVGLWGFLASAIRDVDKNLPDYVAPPPVGLVRRERPVTGSPEAIIKE
jgi:MFS family permease